MPGSSYGSSKPSSPDDRKERNLALVDHGNPVLAIHEGLDGLSLAGQQPRPPLGAAATGPISVRSSPKARSPRPNPLP